MSFRLKATNRDSATNRRDVLVKGYTWPLILRLANQYGFRGDCPLGEYEPDIAYHLAKHEAAEMAEALSNAILPERPSCLLSPISGKAWRSVLDALNAIRELMATGEVIICNECETAKRDCH